MHRTPCFSSAARFASASFRDVGRDGPAHRRRVQRHRHRHAPVSDTGRTRRLTMHPTTDPALDIRTAEHAQMEDHLGARHAGEPNDGAGAQTDELLRLAVQVGGIGIYESDLEHNRTRFSPELCSILGLPLGTEMTYEDASK